MNQEHLENRAAKEKNLTLGEQDCER